MPLQITRSTCAAIAILHWFGTTAAQQPAPDEASLREAGPPPPGSVIDSGNISEHENLLDSEYAVPLGLIFDRAGKLWKLAIAGFSHPDHHAPENAASGTPIFDGASMIELQAQHCTTLTVRARVNVDGMRSADYQTGTLRARARLNGRRAPAIRRW